MQKTNRAYLELHLAVLLFGLTAVLGKLIELPAITLVWWRVFITSLSLLFFIRFGRDLMSLSRGQVIRLLGIGWIVGLHWLAFFGSVKLANASVTLVSVATVSFFTALVEPIILKTKFRWVEILVGLMVIPGMVLVVNGLDDQMIIGFFVGILSALLAAVFSTLNKQILEEVDALKITFVELSSACLMLTFFLPFYYISDTDALFFPSGMSILYVLILALACTTLAYVLSLRALKHLTTFITNLSINLEPVYGILLAALFLKEYQDLTPSFYLGGTLIALIVLGYPIIKRKFLADG